VVSRCYTVPDFVTLKMPYESLLKIFSKEPFIPFDSQKYSDKLIKVVNKLLSTRTKPASECQLSAKYPLK